MKRVCILLVLCMAVFSCGKDGGDGPSGKKVPNLAVSMEIYSLIKSAWRDEIRPKVTQTQGTITDLVVTGDAGTATINGSYSSYQTSSSSTRLDQYSTNVTVVFQDYLTSGGLSLNGKLIFYESYSSRCTNGTCATHASYKYNTQVADDQGNTAAPISVSFEYTGENYGDNIQLDARKTTDRQTWDIAVTNADGEEFSWRGS